MGERLRESERRADVQATLGSRLQEVGAVLAGGGSQERGEEGWG